MITLPPDCDIAYHAGFLGEVEAGALFDEILDGYDVTDKTIRMADGSEHVAETATYLFLDAELESFDKIPEVWGGRAPWPESLARIRQRVEALTGVYFHVARCVYYQDGSEGVDFHQDLAAYGDTTEIASLSLGAEREFVLRGVENQAQRYAIRLQPGSLLYMGEGCQTRYEHALPRDYSCREPRLNLTFRKFGWDRNER